MNKVSIFLARPIHYYAECEHEQSVRRLMLECVKRGVRLIDPPKRGDSAIHRVRNRYVDQFLRTDATHLLFIDADIAFDPQSVFDMLEADVDVIGGAYRRKQPGDASDINSYVLNLTPETEDSGKLVVKRGRFEVRHIGTGFLLVKRSVFVDMANAHPEWMYFMGGNADNAGHPSFWWFHWVLDDNREEMSEDWLFCDTWRKMGGQVWCLADCPLAHIGHAAHHGNVADIVYAPLENLDFAVPAGLDLTARADLLRVRLGEYEVPGVGDVQTVLDIGANVGAFAKWAHEKWPSARIDCVEPHPQAQELLSMNCSYAHPIHAMAVGPELDQCEGKLYMGINLGCTSTFDLGEQDTSKTIDVSKIRARDLPSAEFVKLDTEGCELDILRDYDLSHTKAVALEYHLGDDQEIADLLTGAGFVIASRVALSSRQGILKAVRP